MAEKENSPILSATLQAQLFNLFLQGNSYEQIQKVNPDLRLGEIVRAGVSSDWHNRRLLYLEGMLQGVRLRTQQTLGEGADFLADFLTAFHKLYGSKLKTYIQTGDERVLGDLKPTNLSQYRMVLDLLLRTSGVAPTSAGPQLSAQSGSVVNQQNITVYNQTPDVHPKGLSPADSLRELMALENMDTNVVDVEAEPAGETEE